MPRNCFLSVAFFAVAAALVPAACSAQMGVGARALGLGGAYTAVADDAYAPYWNPAGVANLNGFHAALPNVNARLTGPIKAGDLLNHFPSDTASQIAFARRAGGDISNADATGFVGFAAPHFALSFLPYASGQAIPRNASGGIGLRYINFQGDSIPEPGSQVDLNAVLATQTLATGATRIGKQAAIGLNLKLTNYQPTNVHIAFTGTNTSNFVTTTTGDTVLAFSGDVGALYNVNSQVTVGAMLRNFIGKTDSRALPTRFNVGAAYRPTRKVLVAADYEGIGSGQSRINFGAEYSIVRYFQVRAGLYRGLPTLGLGFGKFVNLAYGPNETLLGVSIGF